MGYLGEVDPRDPLVAPVTSPAVLRQFPPTLILTSTRASDLSTAVNTDIQLTKQGVKSELHVWDGFLHGGFMNDPDQPETEEAINITVNFFNRYLGR
jgi:acetyl esterase/lipase